MKKGEESWDFSEILSQSDIEDVAPRSNGIEKHADRGGGIAPLLARNRARAAGGVDGVGKVWRRAFNSRRVHSGDGVNASFAGPSHRGPFGGDAPKSRSAI